MSHKQVSRHHFAFRPVQSGGFVCLIRRPSFTNSLMTPATGIARLALSAKPLAGINIKGRKEQSDNSATLKLAPQDQKLFALVDEDGQSKKRIVADDTFTKVTVGDVSSEAIGPVLGSSMRLTGIAPCWNECQKRHL